MDRKTEPQIETPSPGPNEPEPLGKGWRNAPDARFPGQGADGAPADGAEPGGPRALERRAGAGTGRTAPAREPEIGGRGGPEPTRYGDWEVNGICSDF